MDNYSEKFSTEVREYLRDKLPDVDPTTIKEIYAFIDYRAARLIYDTITKRDEQWDRALHKRPFKARNNRPTIVENEGEKETSYDQEHGGTE